MRKGIIGLSFLLTISLIPAYSATPPKAGSICSKQGITKSYQGKKFTCIKSGKKLVWSKGVGVVKKTPSPTPTPTPTQSPTPTPTQSPTPTPTPSPTLNSFFESLPIAEAEYCRLKDFFVSKFPGDDYNNIGFPIKVHELPVKGDLNILFLPVAFKDFPATKDETAQLLEYKARIEEWMDHFTNQQLTPKIQIHSQWINIPESSENYKIVDPSNKEFNKNQQLLANRIIELSDQTVDYRNIDAVLIYWAGWPTTFQFDLGLRDFEIDTEEGKNRIFIWSPGPFAYSDYGYPAVLKKSRLWQFYIHEMLHSQGITGHAPAGFDTGLGNSILGSSSAIDSWSAFLAGWTLDEQIYCAPKNLLTVSTVFLSTIDKRQKSGKRSIIIPLNEKEAIVVEARDAIDFSAGWQPNTKGIFAFLVDTSKRNDPRNPLPNNSRKYESWSYYLPPKKLVDSGKDLDAITCQDENARIGCSGSITDFREFLVRAGDSIEYSGVLIELLEFKLDAIIKISRR